MGLRDPYKIENKSNSDRVHMCLDPNIIKSSLTVKATWPQTRGHNKSSPIGHQFPENHNCVCMAVVQIPEIRDVSAESVSRKLSCQSKKYL